MTPYERQLQHSLDIILDRDPSRNSLKNTDHDVLTLFSGDERAAREGLRVFHSRHSHATWIASDNGIFELRVSSISPEQNLQKSRFKQEQRRRNQKGGRRH